MDSTTRLYPERDPVARGPGRPGYVAPRAQGSPLIVIGYSFGVLSFLFVPLVFGPLALIIGGINISRGRTGHGLAQIAIALLAATWIFYLFVYFTFLHPTNL